MDHPTTRLRRTAGATLTLFLAVTLIGATTDAAPSLTRGSGAASVSASAVRVDPPEPPPAPSPPPSPSLDGPSPATIDLVNQYRRQAGLGPVVVDDALVAAALQHSADQARNRRMSHVGSDGSRLGDRIRANGGVFRTAGENVAYGYDSPESVMTAWMNSSGHRANILGSGFDRIGVAVITASDGTAYWTMVLAG